VLKADGFDDAVIGIGSRCGSEDVIVYDAEKCIEILVRDHDMDPDEALDYFSFNTLGSYVGKLTPVFVWQRSMKEIDDEQSLESLN
tara:strand:- start:7283 stop:7540 length:258 start_codon:yes stop_codon:yes gene_type:complete